MKKAKVKQDLQLHYLRALIYITWEVRDYFMLSEIRVYICQGLYLHALQ